MKKTSLILVLATFFLVFAFSFVSSADSCCIQPIEGRWCQDNLPSNECVAGAEIPTSCDNYAGCKKGVCYSEVSGECSSSTFKAYCESQQGSTWHDMPKEDVIVNGLNVCKEGCCFYGDSASLLTFAKCKALSISQGIEINFDPSITDENTCSSLSGGDEEVACIIANEFFRDCYRTTQQDCLSVGGDPEVGLLCTALQLATDCAKSKETTCVNGKVYFTDTCGNLANIYVKDKFNNTDYWTYIKDSSESCTIHAQDDYSIDCGNCDETKGTICRSYDEAKQNLANQDLQRPAYGNNVCAAMDCYYDTDNNPSTPEIFYKHGESWCAQSKGTLFHINITSETGKFQEGDDTRETLTNYKPGVYKNNFMQLFKESYNEYNIPGSRYTRLYCIDGTVYEDPCEDFRKEICMESNMGNETENFKTAKCMKNDYISCGNYTDKTSCEEGIFCKWIYGYRYDGQKVNDIHERIEEYQGSCVPLFAPGLKIWYGEGEEVPEESVCGLASFAEIVKYETAWTRRRKNFADRPLCQTSGSNKNFDHTSDCTENCYILPTYGKDDAEGSYYSLKKLFDTHKGRKAIGEDLDEACLSDRKVYYCHEKSGPVANQQADCATEEDERREMPIFFRHDEWIYSIKDRARSIGDCGYKLGIFMQDFEGLDPDLEGVYAVYNIVNEKGELKKEFDAEKIYEGDFVLQITDLS